MPHTISVIINDEQYNKLLEIGKPDELNVSDIVRQAIRTYIKNTLEKD